MTQTQEKKQEQPNELPAQDVINNVGRDIGFFAALTVRRIQGVTTSLRGGIDNMAQSKTKGKNSRQPKISLPDKPTMDKAEQVVDTAGQRFGLFAALVGFQVQRATARVREEAEDFWAEAQSIRSRRKRR